MKKRYFFLYSATLTMLVSAGVMIKPIPARAQQTAAESAGHVMDKVIVTASPYVSRRIVSTDSNGILTETMTLQRYVSYADLDLSKYAHVTELKNRIAVNAKAACQELADQYAVASQGDKEIQECIKLAIESANDGLITAITAAR